MGTVEGAWMDGPRWPWNGVGRCLGSVGSTLGVISEHWGGEALWKAEPRLCCEPKEPKGRGWEHEEMPTVGDGAADV